MSDKKMIGFSLLGIIKNGAPWKKAHEVRMKELADRSGMEEFSGNGNYFEYVKEALGKIDEYKDLDIKDAISKRRLGYFEMVLGLIKEGDYVDEEFVEALKIVKEDYDIALITTNTSEFAREVLKIARCEGMFDKIVTLDSSEEDNKKLAFERALDEIGKIDLFYGSNKSGEICKEMGIKFLGYDKEFNVALHDIFITELEFEGMGEVGNDLLLCAKCNSREVYRSINGSVAGKYLCRECGYCGDNFVLGNKDGSFKDE